MTCRSALLVVCILAGCSSLPTTVPWGRTIGAKGLETNVTLVETAKDDGAFVVSQSTGSFYDGITYLWLLKLGKLSEVSAQKLIKSDRGESNPHLSPTADGGAFLAATTYSFAARNADAFVARLDSNANFKWQLRIGSQQDDTIAALTTTDQGELVAVGHTTLDGANDTDGLIVRLGDDGQVHAAHSLGNTSTERLFAVATHPDGGLYVAGQISDSAGEDAFVARLTGAGTVQWGLRLHGADPEGMKAIVATSKGWIAAGGTDLSPNAKSKGLVVTGNEDGSVLSQFTLAYSDSSTITSILPAGTDVLFIGNAVTNAGVGDPWVVHMLSNGSTPGFVFGGDANESGAFARRSPTGDVWLSAITSSYQAQSSDVLVLRLGADLFLPAPQRRPADATKQASSLDVIGSSATSTPIALEFAPTQATFENTQGKIRPIAGN